jgi:membrane fusion protein (multidrug efflux system)
LNITLRRKFETWPVVVLIPAALITASCTKSAASAGTERPPDVEVVAVLQKDIPVYHEWIGTVDGLVNAAIRAQVAGYLLTQNYSEGSFVRKGQLLFDIDARPFQAALEQAQGQLAQARGQLAQAKAQLLQAQAQLAQSAANQGRTQMDVERYTPLAKQQAVTQQDLDNAVQNNTAATAQVEASKAAVETARAQIEASNAAVESAQAAVDAAKVNTSFTHLASPIDGIAGMAQVQVGNLVSPGSGVITTVSTLDPIKANFTVGEQEYLTLTRGGVSDLAKLQLELILTDGNTWPHKGTFSFVDRQVSPSTGAIQLTGLFPNPGNRLRPGQYGRVRAAIGIKTAAVLVPQRAVTELQGAYQVAVVDDKNTVSIEQVNVGEQIGTMWVINAGLRPGQRVIAEGVQNARPGMQVSPKAFVDTVESKGAN